MTSSIWKAQIPISKLSAVEKALLTAFKTEIVDDIQELKGGLSPALVYRIQVKGKQYILRVVMLATILNSPARQYACMKLAADAGIAPPVLYSSPEDAVTIVEYIQTHPLPFECEAAASLACHLASTIRRLHGLPPFPMFINYLDALDLWVQGCRVSIDPRPNDVLKACLDKYSVLRKAYPNDPELVSSHNDLNINNLLFDGERVWIIDWEASCLGDRFVDLANIANSFLSTPEQEERYLRVYFGDSLDDTKRARFYLMRQACHLFYALVL
ncbi:MAG: phosphotransferase, partial [Bryobacteraceae bacterium]